jgi:hypothetical protein
MCRPVPGYLRALAFAVIEYAQRVGTRTGVLPPVLEPQAMPSYRARLTTGARLGYRFS